MLTPGLLVSLPSSIYHYGGEVQNRFEWILLFGFMDPEIVLLLGIVYCYLFAFFPEQRRTFLLKSKLSGGGSMFTRP
jgi:hypothetical protein